MLQAMDALDTAVRVDISLSSRVDPFAHSWKNCIGSGHAQLGTRTDWRAALAQARADLGITGLRMHGWLDDDMSVAPNPTPPFFFYNIDLVADYLVSLGIKPVFELDYMPRSMAKCKDPAHCYYAFHNHGGYKGLAEPPADYGQWYELVRQLGQHLTDRYGAAELQGWHFEVWNEPNWWIGGVDYPGQYLPLYNASARALKSVDAELRVGGPATSELLYLDDFARRTAELGLPIDFISSHLYPSDHACTDPSRPLAAHPDCFVEAVRNASETVNRARAAAGAHPVPFFLTEFKEGLHGGPGTGHGGSHSDTSYAAAFAMRTLPMLSTLEVASWWTFSDIFEEGWLTGQPFYGGFGLLSTHGVPKPAYRAFQLLGGAGHYRLHSVSVTDPAPDYPQASTVSALATFDDAAPVEPWPSLQVFLANFGPESGASAMPWQPRPRNVTLRFAASHLPAPKAGTERGPICTSSMQAVMRRIDDSVTNPLSVWKAQGSPAYPTKAQLAALHKASEMPAQVVHLIPGSGSNARAESESSTDGDCAVAMQLEVELPAYGVAHLSAFRPGGGAGPAAPRQHVLD